MGSCLGGDEMANRPVFVCDLNTKNLVKTVSVEFEWHPGYSVSQKQKSIRSLHHSFYNNMRMEVLEISTKSESKLGVALSSFNLSTTYDNEIITVESAYQMGKVFLDNGKKIQLPEAGSKKAKQMIKHFHEQYELVGFNFRGVNFPLQPQSLFYNWLYISFLWKNLNLVNDLLDSNLSCFSDIEYNPNKSVSNQAFAAALFVALYKKNILSDEFLKPVNFCAYFKSEHISQLSMFD